jgi:peptidoglycan/xylan/chitin deacetylase (PgdA/CDA1 family)
VSCPHRRWGRRTFLGLLGVGFAVTACGTATSGAASTAPLARPAAGPPPPARDLVPPLPLHPPTVERNGVLVLHGGPPASAATRKLALTVDDGFCADCVAGYVQFVRRTGVHLTFSPNGRYARMWSPHAGTLRPLIEAGQIQLMNHTFNHPSLPGLPPGRVRAELERNEEWINRTFGTTTRPYYRPPFGRHSSEVDGVAAGLGFDRVVLWNGSYSDSKLIKPWFLMAQARKYLAPGAIVLGHANHPTVLGLFDQILDLIKQRALTPVTLDELFGTTRPHRL